MLLHKLTMKKPWKKNKHIKKLSKEILNNNQKKWKKHSKPKKMLKNKNRKMMMIKRNKTRRRRLSKIRKSVANLITKMRKLMPKLFQEQRNKLPIYRKPKIMVMQLTTPQLMLELSSVKKNKQNLTGQQIKNQLLYHKKVQEMTSFHQSLTV